MYRAIYNRQARQWDVVDEAGEIVAMCGGGAKGQAAAERKARNLTVAALTQSEVAARFFKIA